MKKPFLIELVLFSRAQCANRAHIGLVIPTSDVYCDIIWDDGNVKEKHKLDWITKFKSIKSNLSGQEVLAWRLKYGV